MEVTRATSGFYGGTPTFNYLMAPLGKRGGADPRALRRRLPRRRSAGADQLLETRGLRVAGRATGRNRDGLAARQVCRARRRRRRSRLRRRRASACMARSCRQTPRPKPRGSGADPGPVQQPHAARRRSRSPVDITYRVRSARRFGSSRASWPPPTPTSRSRAPPPRASARRCRSASPAELAGERSPAGRAS